MVGCHLYRLIGGSNDVRTEILNVKSDVLS